MKDIKTIPTSELLKDKMESEKDIDVCQSALLLGIKTYSAGSVQERLDTNQLIIVKIDVELKRREGATDGLAK